MRSGLSRTVPPNPPARIRGTVTHELEGARGGCSPAGVAIGAERGTRRVTASVRVAVLEAFVDTAGDAMFSIDTADRVSIWNHAAVRLFGYDATDVVGSEWAALFPEHRRHGLRVVFDAVAAGDRVDHYETEIERREAHGGTGVAVVARRLRARHPRRIGGRGP